MISNDESLDYQTVLRLLTRIGEAILKKDTSDKRFEQIIRNTSESFEASAGSLAVPSEDKLSLKTIYDGKNDNTYSPDDDLTILKGQGISGRAFEQREIFEVKNLTNWEDFEEDPPPTIDWNSLNSAVSIPLIVQSECVGVITLFFSQSFEVERSEKPLLKAVAKQSGIVIRQGDRIEELERLNKRLRIEASTDKLTGLPNQGKIMNMLKKEIERTNRYKRPLSLLMLDIDHFKRVNDKHGHPIGNEVLKSLSNHFQDQIRESDKVGRYGGEEFLFILPETLEENAINLAGRIRKNTKELTVRSDKENISTTVSIGIAGRLEEAEVTAEELLNQSDEALLTAKRRGRDRCITYSQICND